MLVINESVSNGSVISSNDSNNNSKNNKKKNNKEKNEFKDSKKKKNGHNSSTNGGLDEERKSLVSEGKRNKIIRDADYWKGMEGCSNILETISNCQFADLLNYDTDQKYSLEKIKEKLTKGIYNSENHFLSDFNNLFDKALENKFLVDESLKEEILNMRQIFEENWIASLTQKNTDIIEKNYLLRGNENDQDNSICNIETDNGEGNGINGLSNYFKITP